MPYNSAFTYVNPRPVLIESQSVAATAENVVFTFPAHAFASRWYVGVVYVNLAQAIPDGTTGTLPVLFSTNGFTKPLTTLNGAAVTAADITGTGVYQVFYNKATDTLQLMTAGV